jgi:hypothetical protein
MACNLHKFLKSHFFGQKIENPPPDLPGWAKTMMLRSFLRFGQFGVPPGMKIPQKGPKLRLDAFDLLDTNIVSEVLKKHPAASSDSSRLKFHLKKANCGACAGRWI